MWKSSQGNILTWHYCNLSLNYNIISCKGYKTKGENSIIMKADKTGRMWYNIFIGIYGYL